jgi:hypothetical protein
MTKEFWGSYKRLVLEETLECSHFATPGSKFDAPRLRSSEFRVPGFELNLKPEI